VRVTHLKGVGPIKARKGRGKAGVPESGTDGDKSPGGRVGRALFPVLPSDGGPMGAFDAPATLGIPPRTQDGLSRAGETHHRQ